MKASSESNRLRRQLEEEQEHGDLDVKAQIGKWVSSSRREELRNELKVI